MQELVNKARNPEETNSADASDAEDSSGEGLRLGDRSSASSLPPSSRLPSSCPIGPASAGAVGAGAATGTRLRGVGAGFGDGANRPARLREMSEDDTGSDEGYQSGPAMTNQPQSWSFADITNNDANDSSIDNMDSNNSPASTASDRPEVGSDYADSVNGRLDGFNDDAETEDYGNATDGMWSGNAHNEDDSMFQDADERDYNEVPEHPDDDLAMVHVGNDQVGTEAVDPPVNVINLDEA